MQESKISKELHRRVFELTLALYRVTDFFPQGEVLRRQLREKANEVFSRVSEYNFSESAEQGSVEILGRIQSVKGYLGVARSMRFVKPINLTVLEREYDFLADFFTRELNTAKKHYYKDREESIPTPEVKIPSDTKIEAKSDIVSERLPTWDEFTVNPALEDGVIGQTARVDAGVVGTTQQDHGAFKSGVKNQGGEDMHHISETLSLRQEKILEHLKQSNKAKISDFYSIFNDISSKTIQRDLQDLVSKNLLKKDGEKRWTTYFLKDL